MYHCRIGSKSNPQAERLRIHQSESALAMCNNELQALRAQLEGIQSSHESEKSTRINEENNLATLTALKNDLYNECERLRLMQNQIHQVVKDALVNGRAQIPPNASSSFADSVSILASEFIRYHNGLVEAHKVQKQWEATYQQARDVNGATSALERRSAATEPERKQKESLISGLQQRVKDETKRWQRCKLVPPQHLDSHRLHSEIHKKISRHLRQQNRSRKPSNATHDAIVCVYSCKR